MKIQSSLSIILMLSTFAPAPGQSPPPSPPAPSTVVKQQPQDKSGGEDDVVRITSNLVQVDAVVTDSKGRLVTDLTAEDFEILEDNRPQKITNLSFVSSETNTAQPLPSAAPVGKDAPPIPPVRLRREQVRRTIALVVDDLGISFESIGFVRKALRKFIDEQMQPDDLVAIIRTSAGMGALQQFTSDKRQLNAAIERVRWNPMGRSGTSAFAPIESNPLTRNSRRMPEIAEDPTGNEDVPNQGVDPENIEDRHLGDELEQFRQDVFTVGTLGAVNYVVRGLSEMPGRKSILLITDGLKLFERSPFVVGSSNQRVVDAVRRLTDQANRASVVIYTMDSRGLQPLIMSAEDSATNLSSAQVREQLDSKRDDLLFKQQDLAYLAEQTGGFAVTNRNDLGAGIKRVLDDQKGYYLIGYRPDESTFDPVNGRSSFHKLTIKVTGRPGLKVRYRTGFYGVPDSKRRPELHTREQQMINALASPFAASGVNLRLTSLFGNDVRAGSFIRSLLYIDGRDLTFKEEPDGWHKSVFDVLAVTFDDNGQIVDQISRTHTLRARGPGYERVLKNGFVYLINLPVKQAGAYQLRAALRDTASERVGSANQFIEVPNLTKNDLTLSGIVVGGVEATAAAAAAKNNSEASAAAMSGGVSPLTPVADSNALGDTAQADPQAGPAVRRFVRGMVMQYGFVVYNARLDKVTARPQLQTTMRLFRDGRSVFNGNPKPLNIGAQSDLKRLIAGGALRLGTDMTPGEYVLQIIVTDMLAKGKKRTATQWIDFDIVK